MKTNARIGGELPISPIPRLGWNRGRNTNEAASADNFKTNRKKEEIMRDKKENTRLGLLTAVVVVVVAATASTPLAAQDGPTLYKAKCAMCHGPDGKGETPMGKKLNIRDLSSPEVQKQTDAELTTIISEGKGKMPAFKGKLTAEQFGQVLAHIRELGKKK